MKIFIFSQAYEVCGKRVGGIFIYILSYYNYIIKFYKKQSYETWRSAFPVLSLHTYAVVSCISMEFIVAGKSAKTREHMKWREMKRCGLKKSFFIL